MGQTSAEKTVSGALDVAVVQIPVDLLPVCHDARRAKHLVLDYLELRKRVFTDAKRWDVWLKKSNDLDQYDQHDARYIVAFDPSTLTVHAGARLLRTDRGGAGHGAGGFSYMIKDAVEGGLPGLPRGLLYSAPPQDAYTWELTRLVSDRTPGAAALVLGALNGFLVDQGARSCLFLGPRVIARLARSAGFSPEPLGAACANPDGAFQVFRAAVVNNL